MPSQKLTLRPYQQTALDRILWAKQLEGNDLCVLPTGSGKSVVIAELAHVLNEPILILQPNKEILEQNRAKLALYVDESEIGTYSASMNEKTIGYYTFATIQSIYKKADDFRRFKTIIVDECHLVNPKNLDGMFTRFLKEVGNPKVIGFTATPYRMDIAYRWNAGVLTASPTLRLINRMRKTVFWHRLIFNINNEDLLAQGYLAPLNYIDMSLIEHEDIPTNKSRSDFDLEQFEIQISEREGEILDAIAYGRSIAKSVLVFCSSVRQAIRLQSLIGDSAEAIHAKTSKKDRDDFINRFRSGDLQVILNVGVLTTGFDHPSLDCIILVRPTRSIALYYQMLGRGVRIAPGKTHCNVIDLTSTVKNLGRIETIKLQKDTNAWELVSESGRWHDKPLYQYVVKK